MRLAHGKQAFLLWFATAVLSADGFTTTSTATGSSPTTTGAAFLVVSTTPPPSSSSTTTTLSALPSSDASSSKNDNWTPPPHWQFTGFRSAKQSSVSTSLQSMPADGAIMPDGTYRSHSVLEHQRQSIAATASTRRG